jgi:hypothetical protein
MLRVATARIDYDGPDRLDVTRQGNDPLGLLFAPSFSILGPFAAKQHLNLVTDEDWHDYARRYTEEMRGSYRENAAEWQRLLSRDRVVLVCYCVDFEFCHRKLLAREILPALGAEAGPELPPEANRLWNKLNRRYALPGR